MVKIIIVSRFGEPKTLAVKNLKLDELYKKCKFRKAEHFEKRHTWKVNKDGDNINVHVYAKNEGRSGIINKYEFAPPLDKDLFYGNVAIVASKDAECQQLIDCTAPEWGKINEVLHGGFEDLGCEEDSEEEYIPPELMTDHGYSKEDDFVADDNEELEYGSSDPSEDEYDFEGDGSSPSGDEFDNASNAGSGDGDADDEKEEDEDSDDGADPDDSELSEEEFIEEN